MLDKDLYKNNIEVSLKNIVVKALNENRKTVIPRLTEANIREAFKIPVKAKQNLEIQLEQVYQTDEPIHLIEKGAPIQPEYQDNFVQDLMEFDDVEDVRATNHHGSDLVRLQQELLSAIELIIHVRWSASIKLLSEPYLRMGLPNGNPFTIPLTKSSSSFVPPTYFEVIKQPMDLTTIKNRVKDFSYDDLDAFESDIKLVISNALSFHKFHKDPIRRMAKAVSKRSIEVIEKIKLKLLQK